MKKFLVISALVANVLAAGAFADDQSTIVPQQLNEPVTQAVITCTAVGPMGEAYFGMGYNVYAARAYAYQACAVATGGALCPIVGCSF
ncbi:MAG: hypothetical protein HY075_14755 [Deltaproteobacteria bacterium]|nr:hypothetical protein [Deltaproteobacteria bacterium]